MDAIQFLEITGAVFLGMMLHDYCWIAIKKLQGKL
jgi:hypothetical protein